MHILRTAVSLLLPALVAGFSLDRLRTATPDLADDINQSQEVLYLPNGEALELISFGYKNLLSDILWFNTISYFGKHHKGDKNIRWLFHMCDLVTTLNPQATYVYEFGATMLAWEGEDVVSSTKLLDKAINTYPQNWKFYYLRGFNYMYFDKNEESAKNDFIKASQLPDAPPLVARLAAKKVARLDNPEEALEFLREMILEAKDPVARSALVERYKETLRLVDNNRASKNE